MKAREHAFEKSVEYDQHYHPLDDERKEIEESKYWLREIVRVESGCIAGTLNGDKEGVFENLETITEIVTKLRSNIDLHERRLKNVTKDSPDSVVPWIAGELAFGALIVVVAIFWTTLHLQNNHDIDSVENFQEWMFHIKDKGYWS